MKAISYRSAQDSALLLVPVPLSVPEQVPLLVPQLPVPKPRLGPLSVSEPMPGPMLV